jgi:hypothetical protein
MTMPWLDPKLFMLRKPFRATLRTGSCPPSIQNSSPGIRLPTLSDGDDGPGATVSIGDGQNSPTAWTRRLEKRGQFMGGGMSCGPEVALEPLIHDDSGSSYSFYVMVHWNPTDDIFLQHDKIHTSVAIFRPAPSTYPAPPLLQQVQRAFQVTGQKHRLNSILFEHIKSLESIDPLAYQVGFDHTRIRVTDVEEWKKSWNLALEPRFRCVFDMMKVLVHAWLCEAYGPMAFYEVKKLGSSERPYHISLG